ncbi:hypothetical protein [Tardiphaga robiniae]|uniref:hypothetical protein n=1 Tax=Tardiphaga robiniae TaxID=943830 RepID=UPI0015861923|nr:hypothetical protein [Tardiphaga robiniae]NUU44386.1 hypothetical protein [Tardiphaga robiniae]
MAKQPTRVKKPSQREIERSLERIHEQEAVTAPELARIVTDILLAGNVRVLERGQYRSNPKGDLLASRVELGRERRFLIEIVLEITAAKIQEHFSQFRNYVRQSKQPFHDFDEYWLIGYGYTGESLRKRPENDRHFRVLDIDELYKLFAPPRSSVPKGKAKTRVGKAIEANEVELRLAVAGLILQIDDKIETLKDHRPNSPEAIAEQNAHISEYEQMRSQLENIQAMVDAFKKGKVKEVAAVKSVTTFADGIQSWWTKKHAEVLTKTFDIGLFATAVGICSLTNAGGQMAIAVSAALVGGKPVAAALKGLIPKRPPAGD